MNFYFHSRIYKHGWKQVDVSTPTPTPSKTTFPDKLKLLRGLSSSKLIMSRTVSSISINTRSLVRKSMLRQRCKEVNQTQVSLAIVAGNWNQSFQKVILFSLSVYYVPFNKVDS